MDFTQAIWALNMAASAALLIRLLVSELYTSYRFLFAFILVDLVQGVALAAIPMETKLYGDVYMFGTAAGLLLAVAVVMELYEVALSDHPALAKFGSRTVGYLLLGAGAVAAVTLRIDGAVPAGQSPILHRFFRFERTTDFGIVIFLLLISIFLVWFPVPVKRNIAYYVGGFAVFYASRSIGVLLFNLLLPARQRMVDNTILCISFACLVFLAARLKRESPNTAPAIRSGRNSAAISHLSGQIEAINAALSRLARR